MVYRKLRIEEAERISEIDATDYIKNAWRFNDVTGEYNLVEIDWNILRLTR